MNKKILNNSGLQFIGLLIVLIFSVVFIVFYINFKIDKLIEINSLQRKLNKFTTSSVELKNNLSKFIKYEHNNVFYETYRDISTQNVVNSYISLKTLAEELEKSNMLKSYNIDLNIKQNEILLNNFSDKFSKIIKNIIELGNSSNGYIERLSYSENRLIYIIGGDIKLKHKFNEIKSLKIQYFQSLSTEKADDFFIKMKNFIQNISKTETIANKRLLTDASAEYLNDFKQIVKLHKIIGTENYRGLYNELHDLVNELLINISYSVETSANYINADYKKFKFNLIFIISVSAFIIFLIIFLIYNIYIKGATKIYSKVKELTFAQDEKLFIKQTNIFYNIKEMLLQFMEDIRYKKGAIDDFVKGISNNVYNFNDNDILGQSILNLQEKISNEVKNSIIEKEKRAIKDNYKDGIAKFGRVLRRHVGDINTLSYELISELASFLNAEIGGIYVVSSNDGIKILNLRASFAYNEKKMINKQIKFGEGLVGTSAVDKSTLFIDKVDDDYIKIVSGFGNTKPTSIIISPIMVDDEVYGVIELGATRLFNKDDINFIEDVAEDIAYTFSYLLSREGE